MDGFDGGFFACGDKLGSFQRRKTATICSNNQQPLNQQQGEGTNIENCGEEEIISSSSSSHLTSSILPFQFQSLLSGICPIYSNYKDNPSNISFPFTTTDDDKSKTHPCSELMISTRGRRNESYLKFCFVFFQIILFKESIAIFAV